MSAVPQFRSPEVRAFVRSLHEPEVRQQQLLQEVVRANAQCEFGRRAGFAKVRTVAEYRRAVPIAKYEAFSPTIERIVHGGEQGLLTSEPVKRFFWTSGSTAKPKYIPVTRALIRAKARAFSTYWSALYEAYPQVTRAHTVTNFSDNSRAVHMPGGLPCSSESAYWAEVTRASTLGRRSLVPECVAHIGDSEARYYTLARILLEEPVSAIMSLNPSTILLLFHKLREHADALADDVERGGLRDDLPVEPDVRDYVADHYRGNPDRAVQIRRLARERGLLAHALWPSLQLGICWRSPMLRPYIDLLTPHFGDVAQHDFITMASEGVMAIPIDAGHRGGPVAIGSHFYEFIPERAAEQSEPEALLPEQLEVGERYVVVLTNGSGLYRYDIGDVVEVTGFIGRTPCVEFLHRAGSTCSLTGEKLTEDQVTDAVHDTVRALDLSVEAFTLVPSQEGFPRYVALMEFREPPTPATLRSLPRRIDEALEERNIEYGSKRSSARLGPLELWVVQAGGYDRHRRQRLASGTSDSQFKPTHLTRDANFCEQFDIMERFSAS